jgi:hypothetical protein
MRFPLLNEGGIENLCIALMQIRTADGLAINIPLEEAFTEAILEQLPVGLRGGYKGICGNAEDRKCWRP